MVVLRGGTTMDDKSRPFLARKLGAGTKVPSQLSSLASFWDDVCAGISQTVEGVLDKSCQVSLKDQEAVTGLEHWAKDKASDKACFAYDLGTSVRGVQVMIAYREDWARFLAGEMLGDSDGASDLSEALALMLGEEFAITLGQHLGPLVNRVEIMDAQEPEITLHKASLDAEQFNYLKNIKTLGSTFEIELGEKNFALTIFIDYAILLEISAEIALAGEKAEAQEDPDTLKRLQSIIHGTPVPLSVVLEQLPMTIGECSRIEIGAEFALPGVSLSALKLFAETSNGDVEIATGALGVWKQFRAIKLNQSVDKNFVMTIGDGR
jgi:hypothetical protein